MQKRILEALLFGLLTANHKTALAVEPETSTQQEVQKKQEVLTYVGEHPGIGIDTTAYYFFQIHQIPGISKELLQAVDSCQQAIYRTIEELYNAGEIGSVYFEGWLVREDITSHYPTRSEFLDIDTNEQTLESSKEQLMSLYRQLHLEADGMVAIMYPQMPIFGWELGNFDIRIKQAEELYKLNDNMYNLKKKLEKIKKRKIVPMKKKEGLLLERLDEASERLRKMIDYEVGYPRSAEAYFYPLLDAEARHPFHSEESKNYAVVIGRRHAKDILQIAQHQTEYPTIKMYMCTGEVQ